MGIESILSLLGGLSLFLYGMKMMSDGLEVAAGDKMQAILEKLTANRFVGILVGALITAAIQSSSATTVMVIGFVNSGLMKLEKAVWVIMGANIGTTITGQLIALDISAIAPVVAIIGVILVTFFNSEKLQSFGMIFGGLGILFIGMGMMSDSMAPLRDSEAFISIMTNFSNPLLGILAGAIFTAIIQSSSASIGILQALAASGVIPLQSAVYVLFGQNIGTCITSLLASLSANRNAKRATLVHLLFNGIGTVIFVTVCMILPFTDWIASFTPSNPMAQLANIHTIFNIVTTLLLLPFGAKLAEVTYVLLPLKDNEKEETAELNLIGDMTFGSGLVALTSLKSEVVKMFVLTKKSLLLTYDVFLSGKKLDLEKIEINEKRINRINYEINRFMANVATLGMNELESAKCNVLFKLSVDIERIGDHVENLSEYARMLNLKEIRFDETTKQELDALYKNIEYVQELLLSENIFEKDEFLAIVEEKEEEMDKNTAQFRRNEIKRLQTKASDANTGVVYSEMLTDLERISDYLLNVAQDCHEYELSFKKVLQ